MKRRPAVGSRLVLCLFMAILIFCGAKMLAGSVRELNESREAMAWPTAPGKITRSEMKTHTQSVRRRSSNGIHHTANEDYYTAELEYEFEVSGTRYTGNRRSAVVGGNLADKPHVQMTLDKYPVGKAVTVSYLPSEPSHCVLEPGSWGGFWVWAGLSLFLIILPVVVIWVVWHPKYSQLISGL